MTRSPKIARDCPFCGEAEHLHIHEGGQSRPILEDGSTIAGHDGYEALEEVDAVGCAICQAFVPLDTWNGTVPAERYAMVRATREEPATA